MRVVGENVLVLDGDPYVRSPNILVLSGVHALGASVNDPVVTNDHNINVYRPTLTMDRNRYKNCQFRQKLDKKR